MNSYSDGRGAVTSVVVGLGPIGSSGCRTARTCQPFGQITLTPSTQRPALSGTPVDVGGRTGDLDDRAGGQTGVTLDLWDGTWRVTLDDFSGRPVPVSTVVDIARTLRFASNPDDRSTWSYLADAFPG